MTRMCSSMNALFLTNLIVPNYHDLDKEIGNLLRSLNIRIYRKCLDLVEFIRKDVFIEESTNCE